MPAMRNAETRAVALLDVDADIRRERGHLIHSFTIRRALA